MYLYRFACSVVGKIENIPQMVVRLMVMNPMVESKKNHLQTKTSVMIWSHPNKTTYRVLKGPGVSKGRGCSWGTLRIPFGKIGEH